jgi:hypothetical protein
MLKRAAVRTGKVRCAVSSIEAFVFGASCFFVVCVLISLAVTDKDDDDANIRKR